MLKLFEQMCYINMAVLVLNMQTQTIFLFFHLLTKVNNEFLLLIFMFYIWDESVCKADNTIRFWIQRHMFINISLFIKVNCIIFNIWKRLVKSDYICPSVCFEGMHGFHVSFWCVVLKQ